MYCYVLLISGMQTYGSRGHSGHGVHSNASSHWIYPCPEWSFGSTVRRPAQRQQQNWVLSVLSVKWLEINTTIERVTEFNFLGVTINGVMNWGSHSLKFAKKNLSQAGVISCLKLKFEWGRHAKLYEITVHIISVINGYTGPLFKDLYSLKIKHIFSNEVDMPNYIK